MGFPADFALTHPEKAAMVMASTGIEISYAELDRRSRALAASLRRAGLDHGDTVAVVCENRLEWAEIIWAAARAGLDIAPINFHLGDHELAAMLIACEARLLITSRACRDDADAAVASLPNGIVVWDIDDCESYDRLIAGTDGEVYLIDEILGGRVMFSSGTTGSPKAVRHRPDRVVHPRHAAPHLGEYTELFSLGPDTIYLSPAPIYHTAPFRFVFAVMQLGGTVVCMERFDAAEALTALSRYRISHAQFVPTMLLRMMKLCDDIERTADDVSALRVAITGAAPCPPALKDRVHGQWGPVLHELYGASEGYGNTHIGPMEAVQRRGSVGRAIRGRIHITDADGNRLPPDEDGVVWFEGGGQDSALGLLRTVGDVGHVDRDGYLYLTGRANQIIVSGGVNIHPQEVEQLLALHPAVDDVAVLGTPDPEYGEVVTAYVVLNPAMVHADTIDDVLIDYCRLRLAHYKCPRQVVVVAALPRGDNGKMYKALIGRGDLDQRTKAAHP